MTGHALGREILVSSARMARFALDLSVLAGQGKVRPVMVERRRRRGRFRDKRPVTHPDQPSDGHDQEQSRNPMNSVVLYGHLCASG